jgi:molybdopterin converting factor small subunit
MLNVTIEAWPLLSGLLGVDKTRRYVFKMEVPENSTLEDLIRKICEDKPALDQLFIKTDKNKLCGTLELMSVILNSHVITTMEGYQTKLQEGDRVIFVQGFVGG